jgi:predicted nuclease of restriction endonuclease-like RecB superfamily
MPLLQVRDCPEDIYKKVTAIARNENRTIAQQVVVLLEKGLGQSQSNRERRLKLLEMIDKRLIGDEVKALDPVMLVREDRDR